MGIFGWDFWIFGVLRFGFNPYDGKIFCVGSFGILAGLWDFVGFLGFAGFLGPPIDKIMS